MGLFGEDFGIDMTLNQYCNNLHVVLAPDKFAQYENIFKIKYPKHITHKNDKIEFVKNHIKNIFLKCGLECLIPDVNAIQVIHEYPALFQYFKPYIKDLECVGKKYHQEHINFMIKTRNNSKQKDIFKLQYYLTDEGHKILKELTIKHYHNATTSICN